MDLRDTSDPSVPDLRDTLDPAIPIDDAIDQITAELAAFCFEQLERSVTSHDALDLNTDAITLEDEFRVRNHIARRPHQYIQCLLYRSSPRSRIIDRKSVV